MKKAIFVYGLAVFIAAGSFSVCQAAGILAVERVSEAQGGGSAARSHSVHGTSKFMARELPSGKETFVVVWTPGPRAVPAGAVMTFEYQRATEKRVRKATVKFPLSVTATRKTEFDVSDDGGRFFGGVKKWRVQLTHNGQLLAAKESPSWR